MKLTPMEIAPEETARVWSLLPGSPFQKVLHNEMVEAIFQERSKLETCAPDQLIPIQQRLLALRFLLGVIHRTDKLPMS